MGLKIRGEDKLFSQLKEVGKPIWHYLLISWNVYLTGKISIKQMICGTIIAFQTAAL
jgi:hypothetical protein